ncbi:MAG: hypothetical protein IPK26_11895 [Planctomycetes bacterium]|nr:hypothetical protein [Planctomycetota bacterium]
MSLKDTLKEAVKQMAFKTSLDSLKKKGVQQVSVLGIDRIIALIDEAVHRSLKSRLVGVEREAVADATKAEFLRMLRSNEELQAQKSEVQKLKERAEEEVDQLRRELQSQHQELQIKLDAGDPARASRYEGENAAIAGRVNELFHLLGQSGGAIGLSTVQDKVLELLMEVVAGERKDAEAARKALHDRDVDLLQRRIGKLNESLAHTERRLREVAAMKSLDDGISSVYRDVQGLRADDMQVGRKKELMAEIFKANLQLQKKKSQ